MFNSDLTALEYQGAKVTVADCTVLYSMCEFPT